MLKTLTKDDTTTTPYIATKDWNLSNVSNTDIVLAEDGNPVGVENIGFFFTGTLPNYNCNVAKEDQSNDLASYREGLKTTGIFYPDLDPINIDGTYKRMVYTQVKTMFYNNFRNPTQMWGLEKIDFDTSETKKFLSDLFKIFLIPTEIMGLKMMEGSVQVIDNTLDNPYTITDDSHNNLFAGTNLFSKQQELRLFTNQFVTGSDGSCNNYFDYTSAPFNLTASSGSAILSWSFSVHATTPNYFSVWKSSDGITFNSYATASGNSRTYVDTNVTGGYAYWYEVAAVNIFGTSSFSNIASASFLTSSLDPIATDWANRVVANGGALPSLASQQAYSNFVIGCKSDGIWNQLLIFNGFAPDSKKAMNTPLLVGTGSALWTGDTTGDTLSVDGYTTNGVGSTTTLAAPSAIWSSGTNAGFFTYVSRDRDRGTNPGDAFNGIAGTSTGDPNFSFGVGYAAMYARFIFFPFSFFGYYSINRNSTSNEVIYFANSTSSHATIQTDGVLRSATLPTDNIILMQTPTGGGGTGIFQGTISAMGFSNYLPSASSSLLYNRIQTLRQAFGGGFV